MCTKISVLIKREGARTGIKRTTDSRLEDRTEVERCDGELPHVRFAYASRSQVIWASTLIIKLNANMLCSWLGSPYPGSRWKIPVKWHDTGVRHGFLPQKSSTENWITLPAILFLAWLENACTKTSTSLSGSLLKPGASGEGRECPHVPHGQNEPAPHR